MEKFVLKDTLGFLVGELKQEMGVWVYVALETTLLDCQDMSYHCIRG